MSAPDVSLVIPAYNRADLLERCLVSLRDSEGVVWVATVVDNASPEDLSSVRKSFPEVRWLVSPENVGYAAANNLGLHVTAGRCVAYLNSDAELYADTLRELIRVLDENPAIGAATARNLGVGGETQPSLSPEHGLSMAWLRDSGFHLLFPNGFRGWMMPEFNFSKTQEIATTQTTCVVIRREAYEQVGEMDPDLFLFYNDVDFCRRLRRAGWKLMYVAEARVLHHGSASVETAGWKERQLWRDRYRYFRKWYGLRGTSGVRFACFTRGVVRLLSHVLTGRWKSLPAVWRTSTELWSALDGPQNGV